MQKNVTIVDVAHEAGVSYATVSRVINNLDHVKVDKRERVLRAMTRLGYTPNQQARSLAGGRSQIIGLVVRDLGTGYIGEIMRGIDDHLSAAQYDIMLYTTHRHGINQESKYVTTLTQGMTDGLLLVIPQNPQAYLQTLRQRHFPFVLIDHNGVGECESAVGAANRQGSYDATKYLIELGHQSIGFITGSMDIGCSRDRLDGYQAALRESGGTLNPALIQRGDFHQQTGFSGAQALLSLPQRPTAIFASNDVMAFGVMEAVRDRGLRIPDDVSIVGFDDIPQSISVYPTLTTVRQPLAEMGARATQMLLELIENPDRPERRIELPTELIVRDSTRALNQLRPADPA